MKFLQVHSSTSYTTGCTCGDVPIEVSEIWSPSISYIYGRYVFVSVVLLLFIVLSQDENLVTRMTFEQTME